MKKVVDDFTRKLIYELEYELEKKLMAFDINIPIEIRCSALINSVDSAEKKLKTLIDIADKNIGFIEIKEKAESYLTYIRLIDWPDFFKIDLSMLN